MVQRAQLICSTKIYWNRVESYTEGFSWDDFPLWVIKQIFAKEEQKNKHKNIEVNYSSVINTESGNKCHFQGEQGHATTRNNTIRVWIYW